MFVSASDALFMFLFLEVVFSAFLFAFLFLLCASEADEYALRFVLVVLFDVLLFALEFALLFFAMFELPPECFLVRYLLSLGFLKFIHLFLRSAVKKILIFSCFFFQFILYFSL